MNLIENTRDLAAQFVTDMKFVNINNDAIQKTASTISDYFEETQTGRLGFPKCISEEASDKNIMLFLYELIASSINYCYWYGSSSIRPNGASATKMYQLLDESFFELEKRKEKASFHPQRELEMIVNYLIDRMSEERFPLLDCRVKHLHELLDKTSLTFAIVRMVGSRDFSIASWLEYLVVSFPGFGKDLFLKRAFLFIMQMYRRLGIFEKEISRVPVPADYQVPKMLRHFGCISYQPSLVMMVNAGRLIPEGSRMECEIRAATIVVCDMLAEQVGCAPNDVDFFLWGKRNECKDPFHLTITSNY